MTDQSEATLLSVFVFDFFRHCSTGVAAANHITPYQRHHTTHTRTETRTAPHHFEHGAPIGFGVGIMSSRIWCLVDAAICVVDMYNHTT